MPNVITIADRLKKAREKSGLTQSQLAQKAKVAQSTIANIENGIRKRPRELLKIAKVLNVSPEWLENGIRLKIFTNALQKIDSHEYLGSVSTTIVPIRGAAKMGENDGQYEIVEDDGYVEAYSEDTQAYALRVKGDAMHPAIRHGSIVIVEPSGFCSVGEYVVIHLKDGQKMIKELIISRLSEIVVESVNGNKRQTIEKIDIEDMHPISSIVSASKWRSS